MVRLGRLLALLAILLLVVPISAVTLPDRLAGTEPRPSPNERCDYFYTAIDTGPIDAEDRETATPYSQLDDVRQAAFDRRLAQESGAVRINNSVWRQLYNYSETVHYISYDGRLYRSDTSLEGCRLWEALANEST